MSPPKVSLAGKDCHYDYNKDHVEKPVFYEILPEKKEASDFPAVINVQTERRAWRLRQQRKHQRCRRIVCGALIVIGVAVAALGTMLLVLHFRHPRKSWECRRNGLPETVKVDADNKLIFAKQDHDDTSNTRAMEVLHEYDRGLIAYKDIENNTCYIDRLDEEFQDGYERWQLYETNEHNEQKYLKVISGPIEIDVIRHIGDIHITAHCENAVSVWVMEIDIQEVKTDVEIIKI